METVPEGLGFPLLGLGHVLWLASIGVVAAIVCRRYNCSDAKGKQRIRWILSVLMFADELLKMAALSATGSYTASYLPLHLCSINMFVCLWYTIHPTAMAAEILYALCLPGACIALCVPTWQGLPFLNLMSIHSFSVHGLLVLYSLLGLTSGELKPNIRHLWMPIAFVGALTPALYWFNCRFDTNFMFLNWTENNIVLETVYNIAGPGLYILGLAILATMVWVILYLPWSIVPVMKKRIAKTA